MIAKNLDDVLVYQKAIEAADAISALLKRPVFSKDFELRDQLSRSSGRIAPLIVEGFGQTTDRHLAVYLGRARGSSLETQAHLRRAIGEGFISQSELIAVGGRYDEIGKMLTSWIHYLRDCDWKNRG
jgi:four helix bundle protein